MSNPLESAITLDPPRLRAGNAQLRARRALPPLETLRAFDAIGRLGGVRKAAEHLHRDHAGVSRHLRTIEEWTSAKLIERTAAGMMLTEDGQRYHRDIENALDIIARATMNLIKRGDERHLKIRCAPGFTFHWLLGRLADFEKAYPGIDVELQPVSRSADLFAFDSDIEIRMAGCYRPPLPQSNTSLRSIELARVPIVAVASRAYLARHTSIRQPKDLLQHQLLHEENAEGWRAWLAAHGVTDNTELPGPRLWHGHLTLESARCGRGVTLTNPLIAGKDFESGALVEIGHNVASFMPRIEGIYHLIGRSERWQSRVVDRFRQWLVRAIEQEHGQYAVAATG